MADAVHRGRPLWFGLLGTGCLLTGSLAGFWLACARGTQAWASPPREATVPMTATTAALPSLAPVVDRVSPGVVAIRADLPTTTATPEDADDGPFGPTAAAGNGVRHGSGFLVHATGLIVTARHVVADATHLTASLPQLGEFKADLVGEDAVTDIAVLRLVGAPASLPALELGDSERLRAGDWILAIGNPFGLAQTVTAGVVSFVGRQIHRSDYRVSNDFLQFSAPVHQGSSGCPVFDLTGKVVGVTTHATGDAEGISFAIPTRTLRWVLQAMDRSPDGRVHRGFLGIEFASRAGLDESGHPLEGAIVLRVAQGEPGARAGLQRGDVILQVDGHRVADGSELHERITHSAPGSQLELTLLRDGRVQPPLPIRLAEVDQVKGQEPGHS